MAQLFIYGKQGQIIFNGVLNGSFFGEEGAQVSYLLIFSY